MKIFNINIGLGGPTQESQRTGQDKGGLLGQLQGASGCEGDVMGVAGQLLQQVGGIANQALGMVGGLLMNCMGMCGG